MLLPANRHLCLTAHRGFKQSVIRTICALGILVFALPLASEALTLAGDGSIGTDPAPADSPAPVLTPTPTPTQTPAPPRAWYDIMTSNLAIGRLNPDCETRLLVRSEKRSLSGSSLLTLAIAPATSVHTFRNYAQLLGIEYSFSSRQTLRFKANDELIQALGQVGVQVPTDPGTDPKLIDIGVSISGQYDFFFMGGLFYEDTARHGLIFPSDGTVRIQSTCPAVRR